MVDRSFLNWPFFGERHRAFAEEFDAWLCAQTFLEHRSPQEAVRYWVARLASTGWLRPCADLEVRTLCLAREMLSYRDGLADFAFAMQGLGSAPISLFGSPEQKQTHIPPVTSGQCVAAFALSEREAGSDVARTAATAVLEDDWYVLDGEKTWISNCGIADVYAVFARTGAQGTKGLSAFIVPASAPGVSSEGEIETISPHPLGTLRLNGARIPAANRIGGEGEGFKIAMAALDVFRPTVGAAAVGFSRRALEESIAHAKRRQIFGGRLADLQLTQAALAQMALEVDASALLVYRAAHAKDAGASRITREAAMAKWYATEAAGRIADRAVQIFGGRGVTRGEIVERLYRDVRALRIYEGASEIQQLVIARSVIDAR